MCVFAGKTTMAAEWFSSLTDKIKKSDDGVPPLYEFFLCHKNRPSVRIRTANPSFSLFRERALTEFGVDVTTDGRLYYTTWVDALDLSDDSSDSIGSRLHITLSEEEFPHYMKAVVRQPRARHCIFVAPNGKIE